MNTVITVIIYFNLISLEIPEMADKFLIVFIIFHYFVKLKKIHRFSSKIKILKIQ